MKYRNDADVKNISYINKDFPAIWQELLELIPKLTNKWNPAAANESDPLAVLIKLLAIYADKLNYNIDKNILEAFPGSLTQIRSAYNLYDVLGYNPKWIQSAITKVAFTYIADLYAHEEGQESPLSGVTAMIPKLTRICDADHSIIYTTLEDYNITEESAVNTYEEIRVIQGTINDYAINGVDIITLDNLDADNKLYFTELNVAQNGVFVSSISDFATYVPEVGILLGDWKRVENIYQVTGDEKVFKFGIDPISGACYIQFPDSISNLIGEGLYVKYVLSDGQAGNIKSNTLTELTDQDTKFIFSDESINPSDYPISDYVRINNTLATSNGYDAETIDAMYKNYQRVKNVFDTLVTLLDYENYIYNYIEADGSPVVSNIKASDRANDLYECYTVQTMDFNEGKKPLHEIVTTGDIPNIDAYSIRFYPTQAVSSVDTDDLFNASFKSFTTLDEAMQWKDKLADVVEDAKVINHNQLTPGHIIPIDYDLKGEIYLTERVTPQVARQILTKVKASLREKLNAREVDFGTPVSYKEILSTIENVDSRIEYVALQPLQYITEVPLDACNLHNIDTNVSELNNTVAINRNIMAGTLPWTNFSTNFTYNVNQTDVDTYTLGSITNSSLEPRIALYDVDSSAVKFSLKNNENLSLISPLYQEKVVYSNYLYFRTNLSISKDVLHTLATGEYIYFYETREARDSDGDNPTGINAIYSLVEGDIVKFNFDYASGSPITSLNQGRTITKMEKAAGVLSSGNIQFFTNSKALLENLKINNGVTEYTLTLGEYFLYRVVNSSGFTLLGEGTTITFSSDAAFNFSGFDNYISALSNLTLDWDGIKSGYSTATNPFSTYWLPSSTYTDKSSLPGRGINYQINEILTFGPGYAFSYVNTSMSPSQLDIANWGWFDEISGNYVSNASKVFEVSNKPYDLQYSIDNEISTLETLPGGDLWKGLLRLSVDITREVPCELSNISEDYNHSQQLVITPDTSDPDTTEVIAAAVAKDIYVESDKAISTGGSMVNITAGNPVQFYQYAEDLSNFPLANVTVSGFTKIPHSITWTNQLVDDNSVLIIPCYKDSSTGDIVINHNANFSAVGTVGYLCLGNNATVSSAADFYLGEPVVVNSAELYGVNKYITNNSSDYIGQLANTVLNFTDLPKFDFTYITNAGNLIDTINPLSGSSYLNKNNVFNRYTLPRLSSLDLGETNTLNSSAPLFSNLVISSLSIK